MFARRMRLSSFHTHPFLVSKNNETETINIMSARDWSARPSKNK